MDPEEIKKTMKQKHHTKKKMEKDDLEFNYLKKHKKRIYSFSIRCLLAIIITLSCFITLKKYPNLRTTFYDYVFEQNFSFASINHTYQKYFGSPIPFFDTFVKEPTEKVFDEKLQYKKEEVYRDGVKLTVNKNLLIPVQESGMVVFSGKKEGYGNVLIVQQANGVDCWYGNVTNLSVKLYDYVEKGSAIGEANGDTLYFVFKKDGQVLDYKKHLNVS